MYPSVILYMTACFVAKNADPSPALHMFKISKTEFSGNDLNVSTRQAINTKLRGCTSSVNNDFSILMDFLEDGPEIKAIGEKAKVTK